MMATAVENATTAKELLDIVLEREYSDIGYTQTSGEKAYEAVCQAAYDTSVRENHTAQEGEVKVEYITVPKQEFLRLVAQELGAQLGIPSDTTDYNCDCEL